MAFYLVQAKPKNSNLLELEDLLKKRAFEDLQPFGKALGYSLNNARKDEDNRAIWEEKDYCSPPLAEERKAVLDTYFEDITVKEIKQGKGWKEINKLPKLFPKS